MGIISPTTLNIGAGIVGAVASGVLMNRTIENMYAKDAGAGTDSKKRALSALVGVGAAAGGGYLLLEKTSALAHAAGSLGIGVALGALGASMLAGRRHGEVIESTTNDVMHRYDRNWDNKLDLEGSWYRMPEDTRVTVVTYKDADGKDQTITSVYTIAALADAADANHDEVVTREELQAKVASFDVNGDGRLQGDELKHFENQFREHSITVAPGMWGY